MVDILSECQISTAQMKNPSLKSTPCCRNSAFMLHDAFGECHPFRRRTSATPLLSATPNAFPVLLHDVCQTLLHVFCLCVLLSLNGFFCCYSKSLQLAPRIFSLLCSLSVHLYIFNKYTYINMQSQDVHPSFLHFSRRNILCQKRTTEKTLSHTMCCCLFVFCFRRFELPGFHTFYEQQF